MKKKIIVLALIVTLLCSGCGSKIPKLSNGDEAVVKLKDDSMISVNELYNEVKDQYALNALLDLVDKKILEEKYKDKINDANSYVDGIVEYYESIYGDQLLTVLQNNGYLSVENFRSSQYMSYLHNLAIDDYCKEQISDKEIQKYYKNEIVGDIKLSHILISANTTDDMTASEKEAAEKEAKEKAEAIISELNKTKKSEVADKFAELAKEQSQDETTKDNGGSFGFINKNTLSSYYDELVKGAYKLKDGEYSTKVITTELGYHVILRTETKEKASLEEVKDDILDNLGAEYLKNNLTAYVKALQELRKENGFEIIDTELEKQYSNHIQNMIRLYEEQQKQQEEQEKQQNSSN